jgi:peptidoglycan/LPS O-acetylase OafA/YrhL
VGLDVARGLLMAWIVIVIHGIFWLGIAPRDIGALLLFEMPPIFMITGAAYFLAEGARKERLTVGAYLDFLLRRGVRIYLPYLVYVLAAALVVTFIGWDGAFSWQEAWARLSSWINPAARGAGQTWNMLSWHLWFIAPLMLVTALLPFLTALRPPQFVKPWMLVCGGVPLMLALDTVHLAAPFDDQIVKHTIFYALWALFGFMLAAAPRRWSVGDYAIALALALAAMAGALALLPGQVSLDMQANKFPPNTMFFLFSSVWMMALLIAARGISEARLQALARSSLLKPFTTAGYSIYLWQGIGYSLAAYAGSELGAGKYVIWIAAVVLTIALGLLFAPLERVRLPKRARPA